MTRKEKAAGIAVVLYVATALAAAAAPQLSFRSLSAMPGDTAFLDLDVTGADDYYLGVNVKFSLPNGVTVSSVAKGDLLTDNFTLDSHRLDNSNTYTAFAYSVTDSIPPDEGSLLRFSLEVSSDLGELGLDTVAVVDVPVPILTSGIAAFDGDTALGHSAVDGVITLSRDPLGALAVSPLSRTVTASEGTTSFSVSNTGSASLSWVASVGATDTWLTITSGTGGVDAGVIEVAFEQNPSASSRSGSILVDAGDVPGSPVAATVTQAGNTSPWLVVLPAEQTVNADALSAEFAVTNAGPSTLNWAASLVEGGDWASISAGAAGIDAGTIRLSFSTNDAAADRTAVVRVVGTNALGSPAQVSLTQRGRQPLEVITPNGAEVWHRGVTETITWCSDAPKAVSSVSILLLKGGNVLRTIAQTTYNTGTYEWTIPLEMEPSHDYKIQILDVNYPSVHDESDSPFGINCPPDAPSNVVASDGEIQRVLITWDSVDTAVEYEIYRSEEDDPATAELLATTSTTSYKDTTAEGPTTLRESPFGCSGARVMKVYYYWVKSVNNCSASDFSLSDSGHRDRNTLKESVYEKALPSWPGDEENMSLAWPDSTLSLRLRSEEGIQPDSVWGIVQWADGESRTVTWLPLEEGDGWVVYMPEIAWQLGDIIEMTVGAANALGDPIGPESWRFEVVEPGAAGPGKDIVEVWQPDHSDLGAIGMDIVDADLGIAAVSTPLAGLGVPELPESVGLPYLVGPEEPYSVAQWVWLPLPEGTAPGDVALWYYHPATLDAGWYAADRVEGWLASEEFSVREFHGTVYLGFLVRHGGVAQLATQDAEVQVSASAAVLPGDIIILVFVIMMLAALGRPVRARFTRPRKRLG